MTVQAGVVVKFNSDSRLTVKGTLTAIGTSTNKIIFTSRADNPQKGSWRWIKFDGSNSSNSKLEYCEISYGGAKGYYEDPFYYSDNLANIWISNSSPTIENCTIRESARFGIYLDGSSAPSITNSIIKNNASDGIYFGSNATGNISGNTIESNGGNGITVSTGNALPTISGNTIKYNSAYPISIVAGSILNEVTTKISSNTYTGNNPPNAILINGGSIIDNYTWVKIDSLEAYISGELVINLGVTLTVPAGGSVKFNSDSRLTVKGTLTAIGTSTNKIIFTSSADNPQKGSWRWIKFDGSNSSNSKLEYCEISYGGAKGYYEDPFYYSDNLANIWISNSSPTIENCTIEESARFGIYLDGSSAPTIENCRIFNNTNGIYSNNSSFTISGSEISNNSDYGIYATGPAVVTAINNYWGDASGPYHSTNPNGKGNKVSDYVTFSPWLSSSPLFGSISGKITETDGVTAISGAIIKVIQGETVIKSTTSGTDGTYKLELLDPGTYDVEVSKDGYVTEKKTGISVVKEQNTTLNISLKKSPNLTIDIDGIVIGNWDFVNPHKPNVIQIEVPISNTGVGTATGIQVKLYYGDPDAGGEYITSGTVPNLDTGASATVRLTWTLVDYKKEGKDLYIVVDSNEQKKKYNRTFSIYWTDFKYDRDAYGFCNFTYTSNDLKEDIKRFLNTYGISLDTMLNVLGLILLGTSNGHCYGMASTSIIYKENPSLIPVQNSNVYDLSLSNELVKKIIRQYQGNQIFHLLDININRLFTSYNLANEYNAILNSIKNGESIMLLMYKKELGHAVTAYKIAEFGDKKIVFLYDNNRTSKERDEYGQTQWCYRGLPWFGWKEETAIFSNSSFQYEGYTEVYARRPYILPQHPLQIALDRSKIIERLNLFSRWISYFKKKIFIIASPVQATITDENNRKIGYVGGSLINEIPGAEYKVFGDIQVYYVPDTSKYKVELIGTSSGTFDMKIISPTGTDTTEEITYQDVPTSTGAKAKLDLTTAEPDYKLQLDSDNDGTYEETKLPDSQVTTGGLSGNTVLYIGGQFNKPSAKINEEITYTITYGNSGTADATNTKIIANIPANTSLVEGSITGGGVYNSQNNTIEWNLGTLNSNTVEQKISFKVKPNIGVPVGTKIILNANIQSAEVTTPIQNNMGFFEVLETSGNKILGNIKLQGGTNYSGIQITTVEDPDISCTTNPDGSFSLTTTLNAGTSYTVKILKPGYLVKKVSVDVLTSDANIGNIELLGGDYNQDNKVTFADIGPFKPALNSTEGSPNWNAIVDFNQDGKITFADLKPIRMNLNEEGDK